MSYIDMISSKPISAKANLHLLSEVTGLAIKLLGITKATYLKSIILIILRFFLSPSQHCCNVKVLVECLKLKNIFIFITTI